MTATRPDWRIGWKPFVYDDAIPSVRLRTRIPSETMAAAGFRAAIVPADGHGEYDCVVFQKCSSEDDVALAERLRSRGTKVIFDLCDNLFYNPYGDPALATRAELVQRMVDVADLVTLATPALAEFVTTKPTRVVDDALEVPPNTVAVRAARRARDRARRRGREVRLVWFGSSGSEKLEFGMIDLGRIVPALAALHRTLPVHLTVISNSEELFDRYVAGHDLPASYVSWSLKGFPRQFARNDVCVLPIASNPYTICKTNNRLRTAFLLGLPIVTSPIPSYEEYSEWVLFDDWARHITAYVEDPALVRRHVAGARQHIAAKYTAEYLIGQWADAFGAVLG